MSDVPTAPVSDAPVTPEAPVPPTADAPLGEPGLAALKAEREAHAAAVKKLKEYEDRDKTDAEKQAEETETLRRENAELKSGVLRANVAAAKGIPVNLLSGSTQEELEASADALIAFRGSQTSNPLVVPKEGNSPLNPGDPNRNFVGKLFGSGDSN
jgi:hypothetical protein